VAVTILVAVGSDCSVATPFPPSSDCQTTDFFSFSWFFIGVVVAAAAAAMDIVVVRSPIEFVSRAATIITVTTG